MLSPEGIIFPFDVMALLEKKGNQSSYFRFIHFDREARRIYVLPMGTKPSKPDCSRIISWFYDEVALLLGTEICQVQDFVKPRFMFENVELTDSEALELARRREILLPILSGEISRELKLSHQAIEIYTDEPLREAVITEAAKRLGIRRDFVRDLFHQRLWFGGCDRSIMPLYRLRGRPGVSRVSTNKKKPGRPREVMRSGGIKAQRENGRVTPRWLDVFQQAINDFYRGERTSIAFVYERMVEHLTKEWGRTGNQRRVREKVRTIPLKSAFNYHAKRLITEMGLGERYPHEEIDDVGARGGLSVDVTFGRQVGDADCTKMELVEIVCRNAEGKYVSAGNPILALLVERKSTCIVSWVMWYGRAENSTIYRHLILRAFLSKDEWLDKIGYKDDRSGFVSGRMDAICPDRGPGYSKEFRERLLGKMNMGVVGPPPRTPEGKGNVEGRFGNLKAMLRWVMRELSQKNGGVISVTKPKGNGRKRESGVVARLTRVRFELMIAKAVYIINTRKYRQSHVSRGGIPAEYKGFTPAEVFKRLQDVRRGDAAIPVNDENIYERFLERKDGFIRAGRVHSRNSTYSSVELRAYERTYRGQNGIGLKKGIPIFYYIQPGSDSLLWLKPDGELDVLEPIAQSEVDDEDSLRDEVDLAFTNRVNAAINGSGRQREPTQRSRLKKQVQEVLEEQLAAIGELPEKIPHDAAMRAELQRQVESEEFYGAVSGAGLSIPSRSTEVADSCSDMAGMLVEPSGLEEEGHGSKRGAWFRTQREGRSH